jgi:hypothetical protein
MNGHSRCLTLLLGLASISGSANAITFNSNTYIGPSDVTYESQDIEVTNCTVTIDGPHVFTSVHIENAGVVTHSFSSNGVLLLPIHVTNELQIISDTNPPTLIHPNVVANSVVLSDTNLVTYYTQTVDYTIAVLPSGYSQILRTTNSAIADGSAVFVAYDAFDSFQPGLSLTVSNNVEIEAGGAINANGIGYGGGVGPGAGKSASTNYPFSFVAGSGGGYGGFGGASASGASGGNCYGDLRSPADMGSGGGAGAGPGGAGGGRVSLSVGSLLRIDGQINANGAPGTNTDSGGGAGGGVFLFSQSMSGAGFISANGGAGEPSRGGGGGGGHIGISTLSNSFIGIISAHGGSGAVAGGAGTIYVAVQSGANNRLLVDNAGLRGANTVITTLSTDDVVITNGAMAQLSGVQSLSSLFIGSNSAVTHPVGGPGLVLTLANATISAGGSITVDGKGSLGGPGFGGSISGPFGVTGGGAGYGGYGGGNYTNLGGGLYYGSVTSPVDLGSGGGNGAGPNGGQPRPGGGAVQLTVIGSLLLDGKISANGSNGIAQGSGGGSGGSVNLNVGTLLGSGTISANGGAGDLPLGGGGGGGRIAIRYTTNQFAGSITAYGGGGANVGGAGTIYTVGTLFSNTVPQITLNNNGLRGTNSPLPLSGVTPDVFVTGGGILDVRPFPGTTFPRLHNLTIASNGWVTAGTPGGNQVIMSFDGGVVVSNGGGFLFDGLGFGAGQGQGPGQFLSQPFLTGGGGGHGGYGSSSGFGAAGGNSYDLLATPTLPGSGGGAGAGASTNNLGGAGGGAVEFVLNGNFRLDGIIAANGTAGVGQWSGGGSGGSVYINAIGGFSGQGTISVNGGAGDPPYGGGGGGGRIAIYSGTNSFSGLLTAYGGAGANYGGAGTIYTVRTSNPRTAAIVIDNGGGQGTNTPLSSSDGADLTIAGRAVVLGTTLPTLGNLLIASNSWLNVTSPTVSLTITVTNSATIQAGGGINADGGGQNQFGLGFTGGGGGHGGFGGNSATNRSGGGITHGSVTSPVDIGSPGGSGFLQTIAGSGGQAVHLIVGGPLTVDGVISANGLTAQGTSAGGGSGGSLWIAASRLSGAGTISANGGAGDLPNGGGGGGGRIAIYYATNQFAGLIQARGGAGANYGGAGTIYMAASNVFGKPLPPPQLTIDNGGVRATNTTFSGTAENLALIVSGGGQALMGTVSQMSSVLIATNSSLSYDTSTLSSRTLTIASNMTIQAGGNFTLDGQGSPAGQGSGPGGTSQISSGGGGGHGGYGGNSSSNAAGGIVYDSISSPTALGSGGGGRGPDQSLQGGAGGGALRLTVNGTFAVDGVLSANGLAGNAQATGGGSGGSLWISGSRLTGAGVISANGGSGDLPNGGGGGGGRIAITSLTSNLFTGTMSARGGAGANVGGAGTIYINRGQVATLIVDNGGARGANTPLSLSGFSLGDLTIGPGGSAVISNQIGCASLLISSNAALVTPQATFNVASNVTIQAGGAIVLDGLGFAAGAGLGAGRSISSGSFGTTGSGGGHGGYGGNSFFGAAGGIAYDLVVTPGQAGSGGGNGNGSSTNIAGGAGGGVLQMTVSRTLTCNGTISAKGLAGVGQWSGGGSGGSINLFGGTLAGTGLISANGGAGDPPYGGGGGGGRIAINFTSNLFTGTFTARGDAGATGGGAGTIAIQTDRAPYQIIVDNGGILGTNTPLSLTGNFDLTTGGGATAELASGTSIRNILVQSNSWLTEQPGSSPPWRVTASNNVTVNVGGAIIADGKGFSGVAGQGPGGTTNGPNGYTGGGGGHGGFGGSSIDGVAGGNAYDSIQQPLAFGSPGGGSPAFGFGGAGGGAIVLTVSNNLVLNGRISANGSGAGFEGAGGGSGGSVFLSAGALSGSGSISANGGNGDFSQGGGGGGGRVALYYGTSIYQGSVTAYGGLGVSAGGAGTVYTQGAKGFGSAPTSQLVIDNNGAIGTNTPISSLGSVSFGYTDLSVLGGAVAYSQVPLTLNSLLVDSGAVLTHSPLQSGGLDLLVLGNALIGTNGGVAVDGKGYTGINAGPGTGVMPLGAAGSGGGYGGVGGASATGAPGGTNYGSPTQPTDFGSSGGYSFSGSGNQNLSQGGGVVRLRVSGSLTVDGRITANGSDGTYDRSGGGAGGSIWLTARNFNGHGFMTANGGMGELFDGGGGGGGRIAINCTANSFGGPVVALGGYGYHYGGDGTVIITNIPPPAIIAQTPVGVVSYAVSNVDLTFASPMNFATASSSDVIVYTPIGALPGSSVTAVPLNLYTLRFTFPPQTTVGYYEIDAGPAIEDVYGVAMADTYVGDFDITSPIISGYVTSTNGTPVSFVTLRAGSGLLPAVSDSNGQYSLEVPPGWSGTITPSKGSAVFIPASRIYANVSGDTTNQNFISTTSASLVMHSQKQGNNLNLSWFGINGVTYQTQVSTNLTDWLPYGAPFLGTNGPVILQIPIGPDPADFFRFATSY